MIEQHYTDEALLTLLDTRGADSVLGDPHLASCGMCSDALDSYRDIAGLLCDKDVWDEDESFDLAPAPESLSRIRAFADSVAREDAEAEELVNELLEMPTEWWGEEVRNDERYATAGVVRKLIAVAHEAIDSVPTQALALTGIAVDLVEQLEAGKYSDDATQLLRGQAWRERGFALYYVDKSHEALAAARRAGDAFEHCTLADVDIARNEQLTAMVLWNMEDAGNASAAARRASQIFGEYGLVDRRRAARWVETNILYQSGDYRTALQRFREIESEIGPTRPAELAGILNNIANCHRELMEFDSALSQYRFAMSIHDDLGNQIESARVRWNIGQALSAAGRTDEAVKSLRSARAVFQHHELPGDVALINLNLAEAALAKHAFAEAEMNCRSVIAYFETIDLPYSSKALMALSYLREAVEQRKASAAVAEAVRRYVSRLPQQPNLLFAPPPLP
jgi:tetratricopeptide (TPR) repeat protein